MTIIHFFYQSTDDGIYLFLDPGIEIKNGTKTKSTQYKHGRNGQLKIIIKPIIIVHHAIFYNGKTSITKSGDSMKTGKEYHFSYGVEQFGIQRGKN